MNCVSYINVRSKNGLAAMLHSIRLQEKRGYFSARNFSDGSIERVFIDVEAADNADYPEGIGCLLEHLKLRSKHFLVFVDHPMRLGLSENMRKKVIADIEAAGGKVIARYASPITWIELYEDAIKPKLSEASV